MNLGQIIGLVAASVAFLCFLGLVSWRLLAPPPEGQHAKHDGGRHRDDGEGHPGAGSEGHAEELARLQLVVDHARRRRDGIGGS